MTKTSRLLIIGAGETARLAYEYFSCDSQFEVVGFAVERARRNGERFLGLPAVDLETAAHTYHPKDHHAFVALSYTQLNRPRARLVAACKQAGYSLASYVSTHAFVWRDVIIGDNCMILENNVLQSGVKIGDNVVLWSGNHVGHRAHIFDNVFVSSQAVISGLCEVGTNSFLGVNSTVGDRVKIAADCVIGAGAVVLKDTESGRVYRGNPAVAASVGSLAAFGVRAT